MGIDGFVCHDMLYWHTALLTHPGSSLVYTAHFNPIYPKLTTLYNSLFYFYTSSLSLLILLLLFVFLYFSTSVFLSSFSNILLHLSLSSLAPGQEALHPVLPSSAAAV